MKHTKTGQAIAFKTYDLPGILSNLDIEPMTQADYLRLLESTDAIFDNRLPRDGFATASAFMKLLNIVQKDDQLAI
ncbi:MAG UNVERIFIED_CONTAM: hypothetical protein LVR29_05090 [Microcystis novacekii LVE1205-3]